jgi:hypothetical protein
MPDPTVNMLVDELKLRFADCAKTLVLDANSNPLAVYADKFVPPFATGKTPDTPVAKGKLAP